MERAVFRLAGGGLELIEVASDIDIERDILEHMDFKPAISPMLATIDVRLFRPEKMALARDLAGKPRRPVSPRLAIFDPGPAAKR
jgi:propionate CoA-transferase